MKFLVHVCSNPFQSSLICSTFFTLFESVQTPSNLRWNKSRAANSICVCCWACSSKDLKLCLHSKALTRSLKAWLAFLLMLSFMRPISRQCVGHALGTWYRDRLHLGTMKCFRQTVLLPAESQSGCYCLLLTGFLYEETQDSSFDANTRSICPFECNRSNHKEYPSILDIRSASSRIPN